MFLKPTMRFRRYRLYPGLVISSSLLLSVAIYFGLLDSAFVRAIAEWTATATSASLNLLGAATHTNGTVVASESFAVDIVAECTAIGPLIVFLGAVLAYPSSWKSKGYGALLGIAALTLVNLVRVTSLFWIGSAFPKYLDFAHLLVWQTAIILLAIVLWLFWTERLANASSA